MKRSWIIAALCLCMLTLAGCESQPQEPEAPRQSDPVEVHQAALPPEAGPQPAEEDSYAVYPIESGVWLAKNDLGYSNYYYFDQEEKSGKYVSLDYGLGMDFSYDGSGCDLVFFMGDEAAAYPALLTTESEDDFVTDISLIWEDGLAETLTYVGDGTLEDHHFYSNEELGQMAMEQFARTVEIPPALYGTMTNEDNTVTVQLYDDLGDHNSTSAWYILDRFTATGTDLLTGESIDLLAAPEVPEEELPAEGEAPVEETPTGEDIPPVEGEAPAGEEAPAPEDLQPEEAEQPPAPEEVPAEILS